MSLAINTNAAAFPVEVIPLQDIEGKALKPATAFGSDEEKLVDGKPVFSLPNVAVRIGGTVLKNATVKVKNAPAQLTALQPCALSGALALTFWSSAGSSAVSLSVVADGVAAGSGKAA